jgi:hypothetical protein
LKIRRNQAVVANKKNKNKKGVQIVINVNGIVAAKPKKVEIGDAGTYKEGFHAVFLDNHDVYFGKLGKITANQRFVSMRDVYYLRDLTESAVLNFDLVKLGTEIHSPEDEMHINVNRIVFWEKLQDTGPIVTAILNYQKKLRNTCGVLSSVS